MLDSSTESPSAGPLRKLIDHHRWSLDCFSLSRLSASYFFVLLVGRFAFGPCASGFCVKPALPSASFRYRCWLAVCFSPLIASPILVLLLRQLPVCAWNSFQLLRVPPASISQSRSPHCPCRSRSFFCTLFCFVFAFISHLRFPSSLFVYIPASSFSAGRTRLCFSTQRDMQPLFSR